MVALLEKRQTVRSDIHSMLPDLDIAAVFWVNAKCPDCRDDHDYFFVIDHEFFKVDEKGYVSGGFCCTSCGWSNAGALHKSDLPEGWLKHVLP